MSPRTPPPVDDVVLRHVARGGRRLRAVSADGARCLARIAKRQRADGGWEDVDHATRRVRPAAAPDEDDDDDDEYVSYWLASRVGAYRR